LLPRWSLIAAGLALVILLAPAGLLWSLVHPPRPQGDAEPADHSLDAEHRRLTTEDGVELDAWTVSAREPTSSAIVVAHGYPADKADVLPLAAPLADDHHLVLFDHRGLGDSTGSSTLGIEEPHDVHAALHAARAIEGVDRVGLLGFSMGGAASIQAAAEAGVDALVAQAAYADLESLAPGAVPAGPLSGFLAWIMLGYADLIGLDADQARPVDAIGDVDAPILLVHGTDDRTIPPEHGHRLAEAAGPDAELWLVEGRAHGAAHVDPAWRDRVGGFLAEHLQG